MLSNASSMTSSKRNRIMIITTDDESIIDKIENGNSISLLQQIVRQPEGNNSQTCDQPNKIQSLSKRNKYKSASLICAVCGSSANGYNFGAIACGSCKAFFRRNARKDPNTLHCPNDGNCQITVETRRECSACRLVKCFNSGMKRDRLMTDEQKAKKRPLLEENQKLTWNLNSRKKKEECQLSSLIFSDDLLTLVDTDFFLRNLIELVSSRPQQLSLSLEDIQRLETISLLYQRRIELAVRDGLPWDPSTHANTFVQVLNSHSVSIVRLISFFKQIPEFNQLHNDDKIILVKYNILTILVINYALCFNIETNQLIESDSDAPSNTQFFQVLLGYNILLEAKKDFVSFLRIAKYDRKIIELILIVLIFTKGISITGDFNDQKLIDEISVHRALNYYTELLWKYMEVKHGYEQAIHFFTELILHVISWQNIHEEMRNNILRTLSPENLNELVPIMKAILRIP